MIGDAPPEFVDAVVLVYAFDASAGAKQIAAAQLLERLWVEEAGCLSVQVLQEFFVTVFAPTVDDVLGAIVVQKQTKMSFWDALIVQAAAELGCGILWTEDLTDGQRVRGVRVRNPFKPQ